MLKLKRLRIASAVMVTLALAASLAATPAPAADLPIDVEYSIPILLAVAMGSPHFAAAQKAALLDPRNGGGDIEALYHPYIQVRHFFIQPERKGELPKKIHIVSFETNLFYADAAEFVGYIHVYVGPAGRGGYTAFAGNYVYESYLDGGPALKPVDPSKINALPVPYDTAGSVAAPKGLRTEPAEMAPEQVEALLAKENAKLLRGKKRRGARLN